MTSHIVNADNIDDFVSKHLSNYISNCDVLIVKQKLYENNVLKNELTINKQKIIDLINKEIGDGVIVDVKIR